ncbi:ribonuclease H family protein [Dermatobacter hominis]|uniref:ribonuclease H family protein n=1 Tax=Dermatobacter hominis TaxID=2884263 RepID=UPI001D1078B1|nr:ribonuclease H [Dermatobacter hominis]UDY35516.1 ribonuclease HI [Dermatobacter hominis]
MSSTRAYTDGACRGNPGPGGWAWAIEGGRWASGHDPDTTNQRMEIRAVLELTRAVDGPLVVVSDSTYVVNCWRDSWWRSWLAKGWKNSQKKPVANRDLWEPLVEVFRDRPDFSMEWVKGHGGDPMNDLVDRLAVAASYGREGSGEGRPPAELLDQVDRPGRTGASGSGSGATAPAAAPASDPRVPDGWRLVVAGLREPALAGDHLVAPLSEILAAQRELHPDVVVLTGLRQGAEEVGARAATAAGVPYVAVLPYPDPVAGRPEVAQAAFQRLLDAADRVVTLERKRPADLEGRRASLLRRDGWLRKVADAAIVVTDGEDPDAELAVTRYGDAVGEELWEYRASEP